MRRKKSEKNLTYPSMLRTFFRFVPSLTTVRSGVQRHQREIKNGFFQEIILEKYRFYAAGFNTLFTFLHRTLEHFDDLLHPPIPRIALRIGDDTVAIPFLA